MSGIWNLFGMESRPADFPQFDSLTANRMPIAGYHTHLMPFWEVKKLSRSRSRQPSDPGDPEGQHVLDSNRAPFQPFPKTSCRFMSSCHFTMFQVGVSTLSTTVTSCYLSAFKVPT